MLVATVNACMGTVPMSSDAALDATVRTSFERHEMARRLGTANAATVIELHHDGFDASDPFARSFTIQLEGRVLATTPWIHPQPQTPLVTYTPSLETAVDSMNPYALTDARAPRVKRSVVTECIRECDRQAADASIDQRRRDRAARLGHRLRTLLTELKRPFWLQPDLGVHSAHFVRDGTTGARGTTWEASALCTGRWGAATTGADSFSWLRCSARFTQRALRDYQTEIDISACFNAIDAMFVISWYESEEAARRECPQTIAYGTPGEAGKLRTELAVALGLPMATEAERVRSTKKVVKPALLKIGNGFGQNGEPLMHKCLDLSSQDLPRGLATELEQVRKAARDHPLIEPWRDQLLERAKVRAEAKVNLQRYEHISPDNRGMRMTELLERSFLSHCRRLVEAHILALMIRLFGAEGFHTTCHVWEPRLNRRPPFVWRLNAVPATLAEARRRPPPDRQVGSGNLPESGGGHQTRREPGERSARSRCSFCARGD